MNKYCIIYTTYSNDEVGEEIINTLLEKKLVSCIQVSDVNSFYSWKGKIENLKEKLLTMKSKNSLYNEVEKIIKTFHDYEISQIIKIDITGGSEDYLNWIEESVKE